MESLLVRLSKGSSRCSKVHKSKHIDKKSNDHLSQPINFFYFSIFFKVVISIRMDLKYIYMFAFKWCESGVKEPNISNVLMVPVCLEPASIDLPVKGAGSSLNNSSKLLIILNVPRLSPYFSNCT